jgi:hypothetical protein
VAAVVAVAHDACGCGALPPVVQITYPWETVAAGTTMLTSLCGWGDDDDVW